MVEPGLEDVCPGLRGRSYQITSPKDHRYNCIALAAGDDHNWWWPDAGGEDTWPAGVARAETIDAFREVQAARIGAESAQNEAQADANRGVPGARGQSAQIVQAAYREVAGG